MRNSHIAGLAAMLALGGTSAQRLLAPTQKQLRPENEKQARLTKAEKKRAKRAARNLRIAAQEGQDNG